jgi:hypothetical protein
MNVGYCTLKSAANGHGVFAFEINPANILRVCESIRWNGVVDGPLSGPLAPVQILRNGVSDTDGVILKVHIPNNPGEAFVEPAHSDDVRRADLTTSANVTYTSSVTLDRFAQDRGWFDRDDIYISVLKVRERAKKNQTSPFFASEIFFVTAVLF